MKTFEDHDVGKRGCQLAVDVHVALAGLRDFALRGQMEGSSPSIPSTIAEGAERGSTAKSTNLLRDSKGSCGELHTQPCMAERARQHFGTLPMENSRTMIPDTCELSDMLRGLIHSRKYCLNG